MTTTAVRDLFKQAETLKDLALAFGSTLSKISQSLILSNLSDAVDLFNHVVLTGLVSVEEQTTEIAFGIYSAPLLLVLLELEMNSADIRSRKSFFSASLGNLHATGRLEEVLDSIHQTQGEGEGLLTLVFKYVADKNIIDSIVTFFEKFPEYIPFAVGKSFRDIDCFQETVGRNPHHDLYGKFAAFAAKTTEGFREAEPRILSLRGILSETGTKPNIQADDTTRVKVFSAYREAAIDLTSDAFDVFLQEGTRLLTQTSNGNRTALLI